MGQAASTRASSKKHKNESTAGDGDGAPDGKRQKRAAQQGASGAAAATAAAATAVPPPSPPSHEQQQRMDRTLFVHSCSGLGEPAVLPPALSTLTVLTSLWVLCARLDSVGPLRELVGLKVLLLDMERDDELTFDSP
jgi:hypothetical protein